MNDIQKRMLLFCICVVLRSCMAYLAKTLNPIYLPVMGSILLIPAIGFLYLFLFGKSKTGAFGGKIWWNDMRLVHSIIYFAFAISAIMRKSWSWMFLAVDVLIGVSAFSIHYSKLKG